jgi:serine protease Do
MTSVPVSEHEPRIAAANLRLRASGTVFTVAVLALTAMIATTSVALARPVSTSFADLAEQVAPAVVTIITTQKSSTPMVRFEGDRRRLPFAPDSPFPEFFDRFFDRGDLEDGTPMMPKVPEQRVRGLGSGFIMSPEGYVITNNHVVAEAQDIEVTLKGGESFKAEMVGRDEKTDLALLKIERDEPFAHVGFGDSDKVRVGDWVMAVGNPFGLGGTVTAGIVSARGRDLNGGALIDFLQIDAAINRGNSGGPLFDGDGDVVGINTAIFTPNGGNVGIGFAIPSKLAKEVVAQLREHGKVERGWLGVRIQPVTPDLAEALALEAPHGALVASVEEESPAAAAGLEAGDVILGWDGREVERFKDLPRFVAATRAGDEVKVEVWRKKKARTLSVTTGTMPGTQRMAALGGPSRNASGVEELPGTGLTVTDLTPELRERFGIDKELTGVLITEVEDNSAVAEQGLRPGDVIESVSMEPVATAREVAEKVQALREADRTAAMIMVSRQGAKTFFALRLTDT